MKITKRIKIKIDQAKYLSKRSPLKSFPIGKQGLAYLFSGLEKGEYIIEVKEAED